MNYKSLLFSTAIAAMFIACQQQQPPQNVATTEETQPKEKYELLGYNSKEAWGEHLVLTMGCDDCHSPKIFNEQGIPMPDPAKRLSGHHASFVPLTVDRKVLEKNGFGACNSHFTAWAGPWGISYTANLTSDPTGIGNWKEEN